MTLRAVLQQPFEQTSWWSLGISGGSPVGALEFLDLAEERKDPGRPFFFTDDYR